MPICRAAIRYGDQLLDRFPEYFNIEWQYNKRMVDELTDRDSSQINLRNQITTYVTRYMNKEERGHCHGSQPKTPPKKKRKRQPYKTYIP